jgi:hypothetical protein
MTHWLEKHFGKSWKTSILSYLMAILVAVQPLLTESVDMTNKQERNRYLIRIVFAAFIALFGKIAADSSQVKKVDQKVEERTNG